LELWKIILGLFTAALLVHFNGAYARAQRQQMVATRLYSYLWYWKSWVLENKVFPVFYMGAEWNKHEREVLAKGEGAKGLLRLQEEKRKWVEEIKEKIVSDDSPVDIEGLKKSLQKLPENTVDNLLEQCRRNEQNLLDGKTFITDEDAAILGPYYALTCVRLKMNLISVFDKSFGEVIKAISDPDNFALRQAASGVAEIIWRGILVSKDIDALTERVETIKSRSILSLAKSNLLHR
jgi:hypothetical protein